MSTPSSSNANPYTAPATSASATPYPRSRIATFVFVATLGCAADLSSKWWMFSRPKLRQGDIWWIIPDYAGFQLSLNEGALFGMGQGLVWLFALLSIVAAIAIPIWLFRYGAAVDPWVTFALGCVTAGILGNLFDRLGLHGETWFFDPARAGNTAYAVRDWILLQWSPAYRWPNFNIADSLLVAGAGIILVKAFFEKPGDTAT
jgi:signal peptidase II